jgi:uncharacterized membrane protein HdeD (DUF308 family)
MRIVRYLFGILLGALGGILAFLSGMIALGVPHLGPGPVQTVIGTSLAAIGALAWGTSFRFAPSSWPRMFWGVFLLPLVLYPIFLYFALDSYYPGNHEAFWFVPFFLLSVSVWYWQIRRVTRSMANP